MKLESYLTLTVMLVEEAQNRTCEVSGRNKERAALLKTFGGARGVWIIVMDDEVRVVVMVQFQFLRNSG
eukprot:m.83554 g.83554  ORF g.83554 m.83554 type:complete len:69 (-) comp12724_c0_seq2:75-281(-)